MLSHSYALSLSYSLMPSCFHILMLSLSLSSYLMLSCSQACFLLIFSTSSALIHLPETMTCSVSSNCQCKSNSVIVSLLVLEGVHIRRKAITTLGDVLCIWTHVLMSYVDLALDIVTLTILQVMSITTLHS